MNSSFDESYGRSFDSRGVSRATGLRMESPKIGLSWGPDDHASRPYSADVGSRSFSMDRSFRVSDSSPAERRRLVSELRSEVRKAAIKASSPLKTIPAYNNGVDYGVKRSFEASMREDRRQHLDFDERIPNPFGRTTEEQAERELAELAKSTESLRRLGIDILSSTSAYVGTSRVDPSSSYRATQLPRAATGVNHANGYSPQPAAPYSAAPNVAQQPPGMSPYPAYMMPPPPFIGSPYPYPMPQPAMAPQPAAPGSPSVPVPAMMYPGAPAYYFVPGPGGYPPMVYPSPPPTYSPITPTPVPKTEKQAQGTPVVTTPVESTKVGATAKEVSLNEPTKPGAKVEVASAPLVLQPAINMETPVALPPAVPVFETKATEPAVSVENNTHKESENLNAPLVFEPSGQTSSEFIPPAHVDLNALEEERKRRMKKEFLARRQKEGANAMASMASEAADLVQAKNNQGNDENKDQATSDATSTQPAVAHPPATTPRPVIIATEESDKDLSRSASLPLKSRSDSDPSQPSQGQVDDEEAQRALRMQRLAEEAANLKPITDNSMALVPFGNFLKYAGGSYDDEDLVKHAKAVRPPPVIGKASSDSLMSGRRRAQSLDGTETSGNKIVSPKSVIAKPADRQPIMMQGYLMKTSGPKRPTQLRGAWQRRWFILSGLLLLYTPSKGSSHVKRMMDLNKIEVVTEDLPELAGAPTGHCIGLIERGESRMLTICAETHEEILNWYKAIVHNCALLCQNKVPQRSLPPPNRTKVDPRVQWRKAIEAKHIAGLPVPPIPDVSWFYPIWEKPKSYYDLLGVPSDAPSGVIKKAYYRIAKDSHPDRSTRSLKGEALTKPIVNPEDFAGIALAYETLIDPAKRAAYDLAEKVKEDLRRGIDCNRLECIWSDEDLQQEPRLRTIRKVIRRRITIFCDGEIRCLYWQPAAEVPKGGGEPALLPLRPSHKRSIEMRFVQQVLYFRDGPIEFGSNGPPPYEGETRFLVLGDRLHTGPLLLEMDDAQACSELVHGLRVARCEKSMLFQQKLDALKAQGIQ